MCEGERRGDAFERAGVTEDHAGLARPEAEDGLIGLTLLFFDQARAVGNLDGSGHVPHCSSLHVRVQAFGGGKSDTHAFVLLCDLSQPEL